MANVFEIANRANDKAGLLEYRLGDPHRKQLLIRYSGIDDNHQPTSTDLLISPPPKITTPSRRLIDLVVGNEESGVVVSVSDKVAEVSRSYPYETFISSDNKRIRCVIEPELTDGTFTATRETDWWRVVFVDDSSECHWKVILRKEKDR